MRTIAVALLALSLASGACNRAFLTGSARDLTEAEMQVEARRVDGGIRVANHTDRPVAYTVWNAGWLALFAPCVDTGPTCLRLAPGVSVLVTPPQIGGNSSGMHEVIVRWWHVVPGGFNGYRADTVHEIRLPFRTRIN